MLIGINLLCLDGHITEQHYPQLERIKALGYDGVEIPMLTGEPDNYAVLARQLDDLELRRTCTGIMPSAEVNIISNDAAARRKGRAHLDWLLECATALGAESIGGPFHAPIGHFTGQGPTETELNHAAEAHHAMATKAQQHNIILTLEPLNRFETYFLNTAAQAKAYKQQVDHANFYILYDSFHAHIEEKSQIEAIDTLKRDIGIVHVSENDRGIPGTGQIDFAAIFQTLQRHDYNGWLTVEAFSSGLSELAVATRVWRPLFNDVESLLVESISHIKSTWHATAAR